MARDGSDAKFDAGVTKGWLDCVDQLTFLSTPESSADAVHLQAPVRPAFPDSIDDEGAWDGDQPKARDSASNT